MWPPEQLHEQPQPTHATNRKGKRIPRQPSLRGTQALARAAAGLHVDSLETLNKFVEGKLLGLSNSAAAMHAGVTAKSPKALSKRAWALADTPYVRATFAQLREEIVREKLCTFAEQVLDVKAIAFDQMRGVQGRMLAHALLAKLMGHEAATQIKADINAEIKAGVMLVPMMGDLVQWEKSAQQHQAKLLEVIKNDRPSE
jgi:hypothetical protein